VSDPEVKWNIAILQTGLLPFLPKSFGTYTETVSVNKQVKKGKGKSVPLQAQRVPGSLSSPDFMTTAQDGGKVVSLTHWPPLPPGNSPGTHFC